MRVLLVSKKTLMLCWPGGSKRAPVCIVAHPGSKTDGAASAARVWVAAKRRQGGRAFLLSGRGRRDGLPGEAGGVLPCGRGAGGLSSTNHRRPSSDHQAARNHRANHRNRTRRGRNGR